MPKVSVIVPVYKVEKYLNRCVESLINQTLRDIEIILVDDGSPDACPQMCDSWAEKDCRISVVHKENGGLGFARNSGLDAARGEYVGFIDSDDYADARMFEEMYEAAKRNSADIVMSGLTYIGGIMSAKEDEVIDVSSFNAETVFNEPSEIDELILGVCGAAPDEKEDSRYGFSSCKNIYKRETIEDNKIRFKSERVVMCEDALFVIEVMDKSSCAVGLPGCYYKYCRNGESLSKSYQSGRFAKVQLFIAMMNEKLAGRMPEEKYKIYTDRQMQAYARSACMQEIQFSKVNGLSTKELKKRLLEICSTDALRSVFAYYPWKKLPLKQAIFAFTMKYKILWLQILLVRLKDGV